MEVILITYNNFKEIGVTSKINVFDNFIENQRIF